MFSAAILLAERYGFHVAGDIGDTKLSHSATESLLDPNASLWNWLAHDLRFYRTKHGLSLTQLGRIIGRSRGSVSACEHGRRRISDREATILDELWETGGHFARLLRFARLGHDPDWDREHLETEASSTVVRTYETSWVPGLLQTADYARASFKAAGLDPDPLVERRLARQELINRESSSVFWVVLDHAVLLRHVGGTPVMREQLTHLLHVAEQPNVSLRVVPLSAGAHMGQDGSFKLMKTRAGDVGYVEAPAGGRLILDSHEISSLQLRYDRIGAQALPESMSQSLIRECMEAM